MNSGIDTDAGAGPMEQARFDALVDSYGSAIERWPADQRAAAHALLERSAIARERLDHAARLDAVLAGLPAPPPPSPALRRQILLTAPSEPARPRLRDLLAGLWSELGGLRRAGPILAGSLALGVVITPIIAAPIEPLDQEEQMLQVVLGETEHEDWLP
jgi:hypothetical protein